MSGTTVIETIVAVIKSDVTDLVKKHQEAIASSKAAADKMIQDAERHSAAVEAHAKKVVEQYEGISQAAMKTAANVKAATDKQIADQARLKAATDAYHASTPTPATMFPELAGMKTQLADMQKISAETAAAVLKTERFTTAMGGLGTALNTAAPFLGMVNVDLGLAAVGVGNLAQVCPQAAAALAVLGSSVYATTYALRGQEAANNSLSDSLELGKMLLAGASFGYADYTEATRLAKEGTAALNSQMASGAAMVQEYKTKREALIATLREQIAAQRDLSAAGEEKFVASYRGSLGQLGIRGPQLESETGRAHAEFGQRRADDLLQQLKAQAEAIGRTKDMEIAEKIATMEGTEAQKAQALGLQKLIKVKQDHEAAIKAEKKSQEDAARAIQRDMDAVDRQIKQEAEAIQEEGRRLTESLRTPQEKLAAEIQRIQDLFNQGAIDAPTAQRATAKAEKDALGKPHHVTAAKPLSDDALREASMSWILGRETASQAVRQVPAPRAIAAAGPQMVLEAGPPRANAVNAKLDDNVKLVATLEALLESLNRNTASTDTNSQELEGQQRIVIKPLDLG